LGWKYFQYISGGGYDGSVFYSLYSDKNKEFDASMLFIPIVLLSIAALIVIINGSLQVINPDYLIFAEKHNVGDSH
jgi:hypothetical protein